MSELSNILALSENYTIIGGKDQILQLLLKNDEGIITRQQNIAYSSKNLDEYLYYKVHENNILKQKELKNKGNLINDRNLVFLKNKQMNFEYIGLYNHGRIIKILPFLYKELIVNYERVLAFSKNIDLIENSEITKRIKPFMSNNPLRPFKYYINPNRYCLIVSNNDPFEKLFFNDVLNKRDYIFLSTQNPIIEKRLGINEEIKIRVNSLLAYENNVNFSKIIKKSTNKSDEEFFLITGPGLIIFEVLPVQNVIIDKRVHILGLVLFIITFILLTIATTYLEKMEMRR